MATVSANQRHKRSKSFAKVQGGPLIACIDMGTNSFHMIVCQALEDRDHFEVITTQREAVPFFRRALTVHTIDESAISAAIRILKDMKAKAKQCGAKTILAVATSAVREAVNGEEVLDRIRRELDIDARMISGKEEGRLIFLGVLWSMPDTKGRVAVVDIGGGSAEIILGSRQQIFFSESYKLGAARLTQRFFRKDKPSPQEIRELHDEVRGVLRPAAQRLVDGGGFDKLIGTSGTIQALAKLDKARNKRKGTELHGYELFLEDLQEHVEWLESTFLAGERIKEFSADRNRTILAGSVVLLEMLRSFGAQSITVCTAALREGVVVDRFLQTGWLKCGLEDHKDPRSESVHQLLEKYHASVEHAEQVAKIASQLFLKSQGLLHNHPEDIGHLLWSAAMLHDVGMFIGRNGHHKHSYYLIKNGGLLGHSEEEVNLIASIARYHRGSEPKDSHEAFATIPPSERRMVVEMAALLRLAEALDRSHTQVVTRIEFHVEKEPSGKDNKPGSFHLLIFVKPGCSWEPETWAIKEKKSMFEKVFNLKLTFEVRSDEKVRA